MTSLPLCTVPRRRIIVRVNPSVNGTEKIIDAECWLDVDGLATIHVEACDAAREQHDAAREENSEDVE